MSRPAPDLALASRLFQVLHDDSIDGEGVTRDAYGAGEQRAHDRIAAEGRRLKLEQHVDFAGNLALTLRGRNRIDKRLVLGSHLDSVRRGGDYDGPVGVLAALACVAGLRAADWRPAQDITVLVTRAEEAGAWFPVSFPGSRAALGTLPPEALDVCRRDTGISLGEHMRRSSFAPDQVREGRSWLGPDNADAFLEVHIEQGPVLDAVEVPVGIVTGIPGSCRYRKVLITGEANHSGATPRAYRHDAAVAAAELVFRLDDAWARLLADGHEVVCTACVLTTGDEAAFTKIAGSARLELDMRSLKPASLDRLQAKLRDLAAEISIRRGVQISLGPNTGSAGCELDAGLQTELECTARAVSVPYRRMPSGGGHDAAAFAQASVPAALLFIRNQNGSHTPAEAMRAEDFAAATSVVMRWLTDRSGT